jgi:hypothetical protein
MPAATPAEVHEDSRPRTDRGDQLGLHRPGGEPRTKGAVLDERAGPDPAGHEHNVRAGSVPVGLIGDNDRPLSAAHEPRPLAEEKDLEAVGQRTEQFQRAEDVE